MTKITNKINKKVTATVAAVIAAFAVAVPAALAWPSHSSYVWSNTISWMPVRSCPNTGCGITTSLLRGSSVWMLCWTDSQWATGNYSSPRWFLVWFGSSEGYIHSSFVYNQAVVPHC
jgi:uncharacterized protein YraI